MRVHATTINLLTFNRAQFESHQQRGMVAILLTLVYEIFAPERAISATRVYRGIADT